MTFRACYYGAITDEGSTMDIIVTSLIVGIPTGLAGVGLGILWDRYVIRKGWHGWHLPEITDEERTEWNL